MMISGGGGGDESDDDDDIHTKGKHERDDKKESRK